MMVRESRWAKSARHLRVGWNLNSLSKGGPRETMSCTYDQKYA
jgi:hypothetical protein